MQPVSSAGHSAEFSASQGSGREKLLPAPAHLAHWEVLSKPGRTCPSKPWPPVLSSDNAQGSLGSPLWKLSSELIHILLKAFPLKAWK